MNGEGAVAGIGEAVRTQTGQMHLAVGGDVTRRPDQGTGIEQLVARGFKEPEDDPDAELRTDSRDGIGRGARKRFGGVERVGAAFVAVAGVDALGEDDELGTAVCRKCDPRFHRVQVRGRVRQFAIHLDAGHDPLVGHELLGLGLRALFGGLDLL